MFLSVENTSFYKGKISPSFHLVFSFYWHYFRFFFFSLSLCFRNNGFDCKGLVLDSAFSYHRCNLGVEYVTNIIPGCNRFPIFPIFFYGETLEFPRILETALKKPIFQIDKYKERRKKIIKEKDNDLVKKGE